MAKRVRQFQPEHGGGDHVTEHGNRDRRNGADLLGHGDRLDDDDFRMDLLVCVHPNADNANTGSEAGNGQHLQQRGQAAGGDGDDRDLDDDADSAEQRVDVHRADSGEFSQSDTHDHVYRDSGCGPQEDRDRDCFDGHGYPCFDDADNRNGSGGIESRAASAIHTIVFERVAGEC